MRLFENYQTDTMSKKPKKRSLYKQNIFCSSELGLVNLMFEIIDNNDILSNIGISGSAGAAACVVHLQMPQ